MTHELLLNDYFEWMYGLVYDDKYFEGSSYRNLLRRLHERDFVYVLDMDVNRAKDGINLRYTFAQENDYPDCAMINEYLSDRPCSVLEMMVALARRCELETMIDYDIGDRTGQWFWNMIVSLGLESMDDADYNELYVDDVIDRLLYREYEPNGEGGLFTVKYCKNDLRSVDIWYQMLWYLNEV